MYSAVSKYVGSRGESECNIIATVAKYKVIESDPKKNRALI